MSRTTTKKLPLFIKALAFILVLPSAHAQQKLTLLTDSWPPYINAEKQDKGTAARLVEIILDFENTTTQWHYLPYELSYYHIKQKQRLASFPYFKTAKRSQEVLFSQPVFSVTSKLYYNREFMTDQSATMAYNNKAKVGRVAGYSYGETIDNEVQNALAFASEKQALTALFNHEIDVLPMTESVMNYHLNHNFPFRKQLILAISNVQDTSSLHVIAAKNDQGAAVITQVNHALAILKEQGMTSLQTTNNSETSDVDIAKLITTEGYPLITGQSAKTGSNIDYYTLPQGSKVLIVEWSRKIIEPSKTDRIYKNMMDLSKVVLLNGPHVGKELYVRNMHIELQ